MWPVVLPLVFVAFAVIEVVVDVLHAADVRSSRWLWPYLVAFYPGQWGASGPAALPWPR